MSAPSPAPTTRRGFLGTLTFVLGGAMAALAAVPVLGGVLSPLRRAKEAPTAVPPIPVGTVADFRVGVPRRVELVRAVQDAWSRSEGSTVGAAWVTRHADGTFTALSTVCPHLGCGVNASAQGGFSCPCHTSAFAPTGERLAGPAPRGLDALTVEVRGDAVLVHHRRFKQGVAHREEV